MNIYEIFLSLFVYGFLGWCTEVAYATTKEKRFINRGFLNGPICPIYGIGVTIVIFCLSRYEDNWFLLYVTSVMLVTLLEGMTGYLLEKIFHARWWDYTKMPLNIGGYVCLLFSLIWGVGCVLIVKVIHPIFLHFFHWMPRVIGVIFLVVSTIVFVTDLYITVAGILKMNRRLAAMEDIAKELRRISNELGENIYDNVMEAMDRGEEFSLKSKKMNKEMTLKIEGLKSKYEASMNRVQEKHKRLLRAFPNMKPRKGKETFDRIHEKIKSTRKK